MFRRSDSSASICSCNTDPPEIYEEEDRYDNLESYQLSDVEQELEEDTHIPSFNQSFEYSIPLSRSYLDPHQSFLQHTILSNDRITSQYRTSSSSNYRNLSEIRNSPELNKEFIPDMDMLGKEFSSEKYRIKREAYQANHTREQKAEVLEKWKSFMKEYKTNYPFFEYFEKHFKWRKKSHTSLSHSKEEIALDVVAQKLVELVKKEPFTPSVEVLSIQEPSSNSSQVSDQESEQLETTDPTVRISIPKSHTDPTTRIQNPTQNPDLDFIQYLAGGTVRLSLDFVQVIYS